MKTALISLAALLSALAACGQTERLGALRQTDQVVTGYPSMRLEFRSNCTVTVNGTTTTVDVAGFPAITGSTNWSVQRDTRADSANFMIGFRESHSAPNPSWNVLGSLRIENEDVMWFKYYTGDISATTPALYPYYWSGNAAKFDFKYVDFPGTVSVQRAYADRVYANTFYGSASDMTGCPSGADAAGTAAAITNGLPSGTDLGGNVVSDGRITAVGATLTSAGTGQVQNVVLGMAALTNGMLTIGYSNNMIYFNAPLGTITGMVFNIGGSNILMKAVN